MYEENAALYSTVGQFFPLAIGNETKLGKAYVMPKQLKGGYEFQTMVHLDVITFLTKLTRTPFIDQFLMDSEGPEYDLLPMMGVGREFDRNGIVACQINAEIHWGHTNFKERFAAMIRGLLNDRRYGIFKALLLFKSVLSGRDQPTRFPSGQSIVEEMGSLESLTPRRYQRYLALGDSEVDFEVLVNSQLFYAKLKQ
ncbi:hypothetical protein ANCCEY_01386 [Ancylostoma ceylanicum]|uniref:Methyltransferase FkbM domain-containing protein n=1 Tax=Ancylostoma ceylanicum TaxID=53326 RepID=A0A0D6MAF0_9BILA|nr:hypothetical protein ANCCEY_01386 [Ancylostoma ceylanicum]